MMSTYLVFPVNQQLRAHEGRWPNNHIDSHSFCSLGTSPPHLTQMCWQCMHTTVYSCTNARIALTLSTTADLRCLHGIFINFPP